MPLFLQQQMGYDEMQSGLILMPGALAIMLLMPVTGRMGDRIGAKLPSVAGVLLLAVSMFLYRDLNVNTSLRAL